MKPSFSTFLIFIFCLQFCEARKLKYGFVRKKKVDSYRQIIDLKDGCLLVMLHSNQNKIDALRKNGEPEIAERNKRLQENKNKSVIKAFHKHFNFCPVYFFMNSQGIDLIEKGVDTITFLNDSLVSNSSIHMNSKKFLVAQFGNMQMDTAKYFNGYHISTQDTGEWRKSYYYSTSTYLYQAFIIESPQLIELKRPFPYFVIMTEVDERLFFVNSIVRKTNRRMNRFLLKAKEQILKKRFSPYFTDMLPYTKKT